MGFGFGIKPHLKRLLVRAPRLKRLVVRLEKWLGLFEQLSDCG